MVDAYITAEVKTAGLNVPPQFFFSFLVFSPAEFKSPKGKTKAKRYFCFDDGKLYCDASL